MKTVNIWAEEKNGAKYLFEYGDFDELLRDGVKHNMQYDDINYKIKILFDLIDGKGNTGILFDLFYNNMTMDYGFAKGLKLYDIIYPDCFKHSNEINGAFIDLLNYMEIEFVLYMIKHKSQDKMNLSFYCCNMDYDQQLQLDLIHNL